VPFDKGEFSSGITGVLTSSANVTVERTLGSAALAHVCSTNAGFTFDKRSQLLIGVHSETLLSPFAGSALIFSKIRKDSKVHVHYIKDGDNMVVDKVIVTDVRD
jgi:hypothetical protein